MSEIPHNERGFSLIEVMVGLTVALIFLLIISQILVGQSSQKQTTASGSTAQATGAIALYTIERDARMAGVGVNRPLLGCKVHGYYHGASTIDPLLFTFVPVQIVQGTDTDTLTITFATPKGNPSPVRLTADHPGDNSDYVVENRFGFQPGTAIIIAQDGIDTDGDGVNDCSMAQVTGLPSGTNLQGNLNSKSGIYTDQHTNIDVEAYYNKPGGIGIAYGPEARVYNVGTPMSRTYMVDANTSQLIMQDITGAPAQPLGEGIVALRARYGKDTNNDGSIDTYDAVTPVTADEWAQVIGLRIAVVARSDKREAEEVSLASIKLWPDLTLPSGVSASGPTMQLTAEQRHYRYRVFHTLVPLRNMIWAVPANDS